MKKTLIALLLLMLAAAGCAPSPAPSASGPAPAQTAETGVTAGKLAPGFTLESLAGGSVAAPVLGKITVLNFWATWCPPCREEMPELERFAAANPDVAFFAVNLQEPAPKVAGFLRDQGYSLPVLLDAGKIAQTYRISAIPTTVVIDRDGVVRYRKSGPVTAAELAGVIRGL